MDRLTTVLFYASVIKAFWRFSSFQRVAYYSYIFPLDGGRMKKYYGARITKKKGARNFARKFYSSKTWTLKSENYRKTHVWCERCLKRGLYVPSECVHHKIHIDETNYRNPNILLKEENLEALCNNCHAKEHSNGETVYYEYDENGRLIDITKESDDDGKKKE